MHPIPDIDELARGVLVFPLAINGENRKPHHLDTVVTWAGEYTWPRWRREERAELWQVIALHLYLNPGRASWAELYRIGKSAEHERSVATLFAERLDLASAHVASGNLPAMRIFGSDQESRVEFSVFADWARVYSIPLPPDFPAAARRGIASRHLRTERPTVLQSVEEGLPVAASHADSAPPPANPVPAPMQPKARKPRRQRTVPAEYLRKPDVLLLVGCSPATLWRWVKDGEFPASIKWSAGITVWRREEVNAWREARAKGKPPAKRKK